MSLSNQNASPRWFAGKPVWLVRTVGILLGIVLLGDTLWTFLPVLLK